MAETCYYCKKTDEEEDLQPYGPDNAPICFGCGKETPERRLEVTARMLERIRSYPLGFVEAMRAKLVVVDMGGPCGKPECKVHGKGGILEEKPGQDPNMN